MANEAELTPQERAALAAWLVFLRGTISNREVATCTGLTYDGAYRLLRRLSRVLPIYQDGRDYWVRCTN